MIPLPRHRALILVLALLVTLMVSQWPRTVADFRTLAATAPSPAPAPAPAPARWRAPLDGPLMIGRGFEAPATPYGPGHRGVDLVGRPAADVRAAGPGIIAFAGMIAGRGVITISHGALRTTYEPVIPVVPAGRSVGAGEIIGRLVAGHPGCPADACLHWGLLDGSRYLNPLSLLPHRHPRLLPLA